MKRLMKICAYLVSCNIATSIIVLISITLRETTSEGTPLLFGMWLFLAVLEILTAVIIIPAVGTVYEVITIGFIQGLLLKYIGVAIFNLAKMTQINAPAIVVVIALLVVTNVLSFVIPYFVVRYLWKLRTPTLN